MLIRAEEERDWAAVYALNAAVFETPAEADLVDALRRETKSIISLVADDAGAIDGHIMFSPVSLIGHPGLKIMGLAPMAVAASGSVAALALCWSVPALKRAKKSAPALLSC